MPEDKDVFGVSLRYTVFIFSTAIQRSIKFVSGTKRLLH